jgi:hypothetical protein
MGLSMSVGEEAVVGFGVLSAMFVEKLLGSSGSSSSSVSSLSGGIPVSSSLGWESGSCGVGVDVSKTGVAVDE